MAKVIDSTNVGRLVSDIKAKADSEYWHSDDTVEVSLATVATTGSYNDLTDKPTAATGALIYMGTCGTAAATATKVVTVETFPLQNSLPIVGTVIGVKFSNSNTASTPKLDVNNIGAKSIYYNAASPTSTSVTYGGSANRYVYYVWDGTYWVWLNHGTEANDNSLGYTVRTNATRKTVSGTCYRYRILFTSADGKKWVPSNTSSSTNATASRTVNQTKIDPFGPIAYYATTTALSSGGAPSASYLYQQYASLTLGYSFNRTEAALVLTTQTPVYIKCAPQTDGSAIIDSDTPYVQALPSTADGKIYILLGNAIAATTVELLLNHPVYYFADGAVRSWVNAQSFSGVTDVTVGGTSVVSGGVAALAAYPSTLDDISDGSTRKLSDYLPKSGGVMNAGTTSIKIPDDSSGNRYLEIGSHYLDIKNTVDGQQLTLEGSGMPSLGLTYVNLSASYSVGSFSYTNGNSTYIYTCPTSSGTLALTSDIPTVPTISTDISADASSDTKTASPKAVKTFVEGKGYGTYSKPSGGIPSSDLASGVIPDVQFVAGAGTGSAVLKNAGLETNNPNEVAVGRNNYSATGNTDANKTVFSVGVGSNGKDNAIVVKRNGKVYLNGAGYMVLEGEEDEYGEVQYSEVKSADLAKLVSQGGFGYTQMISSCGQIYDDGQGHDVACGPEMALITAEFSDEIYIPFLIKAQTLPIRLYSSNNSYQDFDISGNQVLFSIYNLHTQYWSNSLVIGNPNADWNAASNSPAFIENKPTIPTVPTISTNVATDKADNTKTTGAKAVYDEVHPAMASSQPNGGFVPNIFYNLGTVTGTVTFALASATDNTIVNHYYWTFDTSSTAPTITWPSGVSWMGGSAPTISASKHYEISILNNIGTFMEV